MRQYYQGAKGGALSLEASTYIQRLADRALYNFLTQETTQQCCYILAARQSGKTSLMIRIADQLQGDGYHCVTMNLQGFGSTVNEASLCQSLLWEISATFPAPEARMLTQNIEQRSQEMANYPSALQFRESLKYIMQHLRKKGTEKLIVFLDEIQSLISWKLQNSFLGLLRALGQEETLKSVKFVLLGVAKPTDILTDPAVAFNTAKGIELGRLDEGDCSALIQGLAGLNCDPKRLFQEILIWTGGKPFLTQVVCNLCIEALNITGDEDIPTALQELLAKKLINNWRSHDPLSHFQEVERWYRTGYTTVEERIRALELYKQLLKQVNKIYFDGGREEQINLIVSGLGAKSEDYINVSNRLYQKVFNGNWVEDTKEFIKNQEGEMAYSDKLYNREVYILVDASASMDDVDEKTDGLPRFEFLEETIAGDIQNLISYTSKDGQKICDEVYLYFFNQPVVKEQQVVTHKGQIQKLFEETSVQGGTAINQTFKACCDLWLNGAGRKEGKGGIAIIYTDGAIGNPKKFAALITDHCQELENQDEFKVIILGYGSDIEKKENTSVYLDLDFNAKDNIDRHGRPCNILTFDLGIYRAGNILDEIDRELRMDDPSKATVVPDWVKELNSEWLTQAKKSGLVK